MADPAGDTQPWRRQDAGRGHGRDRLHLQRPLFPTWVTDAFLVAFSAGVVLAAGIIVYLIQRSRGVDLRVTIHEIDESPAQAEAAEAMAAGQAGKTLPPESTVSGKSADPPAAQAEGTIS